MKKDFDVVIIGSGIAGMNFALRMAKHFRVLIITKKRLLDSNTSYAQGGIAAVLGKNDTFDAHISDTLRAGAYHNDKKAVEFLVKNAPIAIERLKNLGVKFDNDLTREAGHSKQRIAHTADHIGKSLSAVFSAHVRKHPNITIWENTFALDLLTQNNICFGVSVIKNNSIEQIFCSEVALCTGGIGQLYKYTTNPRIATGDGIAMAARAGAKLKDLEFIQFHPTAFKSRRNPLFLLSESLRGEGAILVNQKGERFTDEMAPRDFVSRAIFEEQTRGPVYLKFKKPPKHPFPMISAQLKKYGYDLFRDRIPVTPAAHYLCGGVQVNLRGETSVKNLYAFGEVSCTGVHGANRLASNSLLEALVWTSLFEIKPRYTDGDEFFEVKPRYEKMPQNSKLVKKHLQALMWNHVGIVRTHKGLQEALKEIKMLELQPASAEIKNMLLVAKLITAAALKRKKSLGCHFIQK